MSIHLWRIVPQIVKVRGVEIEVNCKQIRFFPKFNASGGLEGFGLLQSCPFQVCIQRAGWPDDAIFKVRYNDKSGKFSIIYNEQMDPVDPYDRRWEPGKVRKVVNKDDHLSTDRIEEILASRIKTTDGRTETPDVEFIEQVLGELILAAEAARKAA